MVSFDELELVFVPIVLGIVEILKRLGLPTKYAPIASLVVSLGYFVIRGGVNESTLLSGLVVGLSASGLYSGTKKVLKH